MILRFYFRSVTYNVHKRRTYYKSLKTNFVKGGGGSVLILHLKETVDLNLKILITVLKFD